MLLKMKELPISERPYEKLELYGSEYLSNAELLAIIIKTGTKDETSITLAQKILNLMGNQNNLNFLQTVSIEEFMEIKGIGKVKAIQLKAVGELTKRMLKPINTKKITIKTPQDVANLVMNELRNEKREKAKLLIMNSKNILLRVMDISYGGTNYAIIEPKEVLAEAVKMQAPKIILIHNHPSGDPTPSKDDYRVTDRIYDSAELLGVELVDHIVVGNGTYQSILLNRKDINNV